jgi:heptosyltransferase I
MGQGIDLLGGFLRIVPERRAPPIDGSTVKRVLIVKLSSIGDVVHALPVASALKDADPSRHIAWAVDRWTAPLVTGHPAIDRVLVGPSVLRDVRRDQYDVVLDLQGLARSAIISAFAKTRYRIARAGQREGAHLVSRAVPLPDAPVHAVEEYLSVARHVGAGIGPPRFDLPVQADARQRVDDRLADARRTGRTTSREIVVAPSASKAWKGWPMRRWREVIDALSAEGQVFLIGTAADRFRHAALVARLARPVIDWTGETTLAEVVALIERAALVIANDSGVAHVAAALGVPVTAIYGPTNPERLSPFGQADRVVAHRERCGQLCPAYCVRGRRCLDAVEASEVIAKALGVFSGAERQVGRVS